MRNVRNVKGVLFADYVRMMRGHKGVDWKRHLEEADVAFLSQRIDPAGWYPMTSFERMGNAILAEVAGGDVDLARMWGRVSVDQLRASMPTLVAENDPLETLMRFRVLRSTFFDFEPLDVLGASPDHAAIQIRYHMGDQAEEAASLQTMGFFERLLVVAGADSVNAKFKSRSWAGDERTLLELHWVAP